LNKKKNISLGLILALLFPMLYLPLSVNNKGLAISSVYESMPYTYEEWRIYLLELNEMTLEDLGSLEPLSIYYLNTQARIYAGWSNGTYTDEERDQLFDELHSSPIISDPTFNRNDDERFEATTMITVVPLAFEHCFRVYAYLDYNRGDTNINGGNKFHDLATTKPPAGDTGYPGSWPGYLTWDDYPYVNLPFISDLNPYEGFMGSHYAKGTHHGQQILPVDWYGFQMDNPLDGTGYSAPKPVYYIIQMLYRYDTITGLTNYQCHFKWVTKVYEVTINDDDTTGPILPVETIFFPVDPIHMPSFIYDSDDSFEVEVLGYDLESGLGNRITFDGKNVPDGVYLSDVLIEWDIWNEENNIYAYWYRYTVTNDFEYTPGYKTVNLKVWNNDNDGWAGDPDSTTEQVSFWVIDDDTSEPEIDYIYTGDGTDGNSGEIIITASDVSGLSVDPTGTYAVPNSLGIHDFTFIATDNDNDRPNDALTKTLEISIEINDDDILGPVIEYEYTGDGTDGNNGTLVVTASDPSGLSVDPTGTYSVPNSLGTHDFTFTATDNDNDREGEDDTSTETLEIPIEIIDDDIEEPYFENLMITDDHLWLNIGFIGIDDLQLLGDDDEGLSNVEVFVDDNLIHIDSSSSYETVFDFSFPNDWIWEPGIHSIQIDITDADNDRISDSLSNTILGQFEVTLDEMYQYVMWLCEEINNYIYDNGITALYGVVTQKLVKIQGLLWEAYQLIQEGYLHTGLVRQKMAEIKLEIAETKTELMINKQSMSLEHFAYLQECIRDVRNRIVELMGSSIGEFSHDISLVEIDVYKLRDFVEDNILATDSENLVNTITLTAEKLENAIFDISLDKSTEGSLTSAQSALDKVRIEVVALAGKGKISEDLKLELLTKIIPIQAKIELLKQQI
jgi:hypothetical protein